MANKSRSAIGAISPMPTEEETAAITAAIAVVLAEAEAKSAAATPLSESSGRWRFSHRRWRRPTWK